MGIIAEAVPSGEICNNIDDDCDGLTDEGVRNNCGTYPQWCEVEACNNIDDDCDGDTEDAGGSPPTPAAGPCGAYGAARRCATAPATTATGSGHRRPGLQRTCARVPAP